MSTSYPSHDGLDSNPASTRRSPRAPVVTDGRTRGRFSRPERARLHQLVRERRRAEQSIVRDRRQAIGDFASEYGLQLPPHGIIDHVKFSLLCSLARPDRERLAELGFAPERIKVRAKRGPNDRVFDPEPGAELLLRQSDGCRVYIFKTRVAVTACLARVRGLTNDRLNELAEPDVVAACRAVTEDLLPWTTHHASVYNIEWGVVELALARDVLADATDFCSAYEQAKWVPVRSMPIRYKSGLAWSGAENRLTIYDKGREMIAHGTLGGPSPGEVMRVERQWRGARAISKLASELAHGPGHSIRFVEHGSEGKPVAVRRVIEHSLLHGLLARELSLLDQPSPVGVSRVNAIAIHINECPPFLLLMRNNTDPKTFRSYRQLALTHALEKAGVRTLLQACYGRT